MDRVNDLRRRKLLKDLEAKIARQEATLEFIDQLPLTDDQRRARAKEIAARIYNDEVSDFMKPKIFG